MGQRASAESEGNVESGDPAESRASFGPRASLGLRGSFGPPFELRDPPDGSVLSSMEAERARRSTERTNFASAGSYSTSLPGALETSNTERRARPGSETKTREAAESSSMSTGRTIWPNLAP